MQANKLAKDYITKYGFGDIFESYQDNSANPFLGKEMGTNGHKISDQTKNNIDSQTNELIKFAYEKALDLIDLHEKSFLEIIF